MMTAELQPMTDNKPDKPAGVLLLDVRQVAAALSVSERTARQLIADGELPAVRLGGSVKVRAVDLASFVASLPAAKRPDDQSSGA